MRNQLPLILALSAVLATGPALAESGEADAAGATGAGKAHSTTREERAQARKERLKQSAHENRSGELSPGGEASGAAASEGQARKYSKSERAQARKNRLKETARENRSGAIQSGER